MKNRFYQVMGFDHGELVNTAIDLHSLLVIGIKGTEEDDPEFVISLSEQLDELLEMAEGNAKNVYLSRDHEDSKGVIRREQ